MNFKVGQTVSSITTGISGKVVEVQEPTDAVAEKVYVVETDDGTKHNFPASDLETAEG